MKRLSIYLLLVCFAVFAAQSSSAQKKEKKDEKHETHVKVKLIEDGKVTVIDTVFYDADGHEKMFEMMELRGLSDSLIKKHHVWISDDGGENHGRHKKRLKTFVFSSDSACDGKEMRIMNRIRISDEDGNVILHGGDSCIKKDICIEMLEGGDHKMHMIESHGKKGEKVFIINDSDDVEITEEDGHKIIKIKTSGDEKMWIEKDKDVDVTVEVEVDDQNGKKVKKIKRKKKKE
ncbi:hypothetical protein [Labilibaculum euxinus]